MRFLCFIFWCALQWCQPAARPHRDNCVVIMTRPARPAGQPAGPACVGPARATLVPVLPLHLSVTS